MKSIPLTRRVRQFTNRPIIRNIFAVAGGAATAQAISMAFAPVITRLYGPEAFGIQSIFMSLAGILIPIAGLTYPIAIVLPESNSEAASLGRLSIYIGIAMSILVAGIFVVFGVDILMLLDASEISGYIFLIPILMFFTVVNSVLAQWLIRLRAFNLTARVTIVQALVISMIKSTIGLVSPTATALIVTNTINGLLGAVLMGIGLRKSQSTNLIPKADPNSKYNLLGLAKRYRDFPLLRAPQTLVNAVSHSLPIMLLASYFGPSAAGFYSIATVVLGVPATLIGGAVTQVFYPRINSALRNGEDVTGLIAKATVGMFLVGLLPFSIVMLYGPEIFEIVFGVGWSVAGEYARWLSVWLLFAFSNKPVVSAIPVVQLQGFLLSYEIISVLLRFLALYVGFLVLKSDTSAIAIFSIVGAALNIVLIGYVMHASRGAERLESR